MEIGVADDLHVGYVLWWSQPDLMNSGYLFRSCDSEAGEVKTVVVAVWAGGIGNLRQHWSWTKETCALGKCVLVVNGSGTGPHEPYLIYGKPARRLFGVMHKLTDDLLWLGDSLAAIRTYDIIRCADVIRELDECHDAVIEFYTVGRHGLYVQLASVLDDRIEVPAIDDAFDGSITDRVKAREYETEDSMSFVIPGILQYLDLPELRRKGDQQ
ncbi:hypothetical protein [Paenibacillus sp. GCM10027626]|uniref:hypothetical protein n=1 Tax=Paenibacillus sp. GCM10027626 TaxID=3273411 RepID=UPI0036392D19